MCNCTFGGCSEKTAWKVQWTIMECISVGTRTCQTLCTTFQCDHECSSSNVGPDQWWQVADFSALDRKYGIPSPAQGWLGLAGEMELPLSRRRDVKVHWTLIEWRANQRELRRHSAMHYFINFPPRVRLPAGCTESLQTDCRRLMLCILYSRPGCSVRIRSRKHSR